MLPSLPRLSARGAVLAGAGWLVVYAALAVRYPGALWLSSGLYFVPIAIAFGLTVHAVRRCPPEQRWFWRLTVAGVGLWLTGEILYAEEALRGASSPNVSDLCFLSSYVPMALTLIAIAGKDGWRRVTINAVVDSFLVTAGLGYVAFVNLLEPGFTGGSKLAFGVLSAYPALDLLMVLLISLVSLALGRNLPLAYKLVLAAFLTTSVSDLAFTYAYVHGGYQAGSLGDLGWQAEAVLICVGAVVGANSPSRRLQPRVRSVDAGVWLVAGTVAVIIAGAAKDAVDAGTATSVVVAAITAVVLLTARTLSGEREIRKAHRAEHDRADELEAIVERRTQKLRESVEALDRSQREMVRRLGQAIHLRSEETGAHVDRLAVACGLVARQLGMSEHESDVLEAASPLHDVGKIAVPDAILQKPGRLTFEERAVVQRHAEQGFQMLDGSQHELLQMAALIARCHHERWDGTGYPRRLRGEQIPLAARIVTVCDVFDALTSDRVYRPALPLDQVIEMLRDGAGSQFDPRVVEAFLAVLPQTLAATAGIVDQAA